MFEYLTNIFKKKPNKDKLDPVKESGSTEEIHIDPILLIGPPALELPDSPTLEVSVVELKQEIQEPSPPPPPPKKIPLQCPRCSLRTGSLDKECRLCHYILGGI